MKRSIALTLAVLAFSLILIAGCMSNAPTGTTGTETPTVTAATSAATAGGTILNQRETAVLTNGSYAVNASVEEISVDTTGSGARKINIYVHASNTGTTPVKLQWFSRITDATGRSYGGINISHDGSGAETGPLGKGDSETPRDYVVIDSDKDYRALSQGATLEVFFTATPVGSTGTPADFTAAWSLSPTIFT
jgi:hypothetical protein